jgi:hypothetical protein
LLQRIVKRLAGIFRRCVLVNRLLQGFRNIVNDKAPVNRRQGHTGWQLRDEGLFPPIVFELGQFRDIFSGRVDPFDPVLLTRSQASFLSLLNALIEIGFTSR